MPLLPEIERLRALVEPLVGEHGLVLYDLELLTAKRVPLLRVLVERPERSAPGTGVSIEELVRLNHALSSHFDEVDPIHSAYRLEVSSPGVERKLSERRHFEGAVGERIRLVLKKPLSGKISLDAWLRAVEAEELVLGVEALAAASDAEGSGSRKRGKPAEEQRLRLPMASIKSAQTIYEWQKGKKKK